MRTRKRQPRVTLGTETSIINKKERKLGTSDFYFSKRSTKKQITSTSIRKDGLMHVANMDQLTFMHQ